jgi:hypothetical protein
MTPKWMPSREQRVIEIICGIMHHTEPLHHPSRACIASHSERDDFFKPAYLKAESEDCPRAFCRVPLPPVRGAEAPSDLHTWREGRCEPRHREPNEARACGDVGDLYGPQTEPVLVEVCLYPGDESVTFLLG